jgi:hypothetical protein
MIIVIHTVCHGINKHFTDVKIMKEQRSDINLNRKRKAQPTVNEMDDR